MAAILILSPALTADLRELFLAAPPILNFPAARVRTEHSAELLPSPRLSFVGSAERRVPQMDGTCRLTVTATLVTSLDRVADAAHQELAAALHAWWLGMDAFRGGTGGSGGGLTRCYLHDWLPSPAATGKDEGQREQMTRLVADAVLSLRATPPAP